MNNAEFRFTNCFAFHFNRPRVYSCKATKLTKSRSQNCIRRYQCQLGAPCIQDVRASAFPIGDSDQSEDFWTKPRIHIEEFDCRAVTFPSQIDPITNLFGDSALNLAVINGHDQVVNLLLNHPQIEPNHGRLSVAVCRGRHDPVKQLLGDRRIKIGWRLSL